MEGIAAEVHHVEDIAAAADIAAGVHPVTGIAAAVDDAAEVRPVADMAAGVHPVADMADAACIDVVTPAAEDLLGGNAAGGTGMEVLDVAVLLAGKHVHLILVVHEEVVHFEK